MSPQAPQLHAPFSMEAEQNVLGALLIDNTLWDEVRALVSGSDFYRADHQMLFGAIQQMLEKRQACDFVTLAEHLRNQGKLDEAGGIAYLGALTVDVYSSSNARHYAEIVRDRSLLRSIIALGADLSSMGYRPEGRSPNEILTEGDRRLTQVRASSQDRGASYSTMATVMERVENRLESLRGTTALPGLATGFTDFDKLTTGLHPGDLIIIAGRPSMGKTSFAMNIAEHVAMIDKKAVAVFSMEMSAEQLGQRCAASFGRIGLQHLRSGDMDEHAWARFVHASALLREAPLYVDDTSALSPYELRARARRMAARHDLKLIIVDYLQLMQVPSKSRDENRTNEIAEISRNLKALAKELGVPIIALSQLNRSVEQRTNKRPRMADLRESGGIEQDADLVVFIYRDEVYDPNSSAKGTAELLVEKQRNGPVGMRRVAWLAQYTRFVNLAPEHAQDANSNLDF